jgi:spermidine synthase
VSVPPRPRASFLLPLAFFFVSGACALVYQVVWVRQLLLLTGSTTAAVSTVLATFMAGLGLGAWAFGARADRSASPLRLYAYLELGIGLYALVLPQILAAATPSYVAVARALAGHPAALLLLRAGLGGLVLVVPTVLMGGTLPVLVRYVGRSLERFGTDLGLLYGANLVGGVVGSLAAGFVLIRWLGIHGATLTAVLANLLVGLAALLVAGHIGAGVSSSAAPVEERFRLDLPAGARPLIWAVVVLSGVTTMAYEVLWTRVLVFALTSTVYAFTLILATFLLGLAFGSRLFISVERRPRPLAFLAAAHVLAGLSALLLTPLSSRAADLVDWLTARSGYAGGAFLGATALAAALVILVPATFMGLVFPLGLRLLVDDLTRSGRRVGAAYLANTAGSVVGSLGTGFVLIPVLGLKGTLLCLATIQVALGVVLLLPAGLPAPQRRRLLGASAGMLLAGAIAASLMLRGPSPFDRRLPVGKDGPTRFEAHRDAIGTSVSVISVPGSGRRLRIDGFDAAGDATSAGYMPMMTHIPMLIHPDPRRLLVICFGTGSTAGAGLLHPGTSVDAVDINRAVFEFAPLFSAWNHNVASDPRARLIVDDGRNYLLTSRERYDVITSEPMPPRFAGVVNLYSREYYLLARERLRPGGLVVQWLPLHLVTAEDALAILRTVSDVFPECSLWMYGLTGIVVARRDQPVALDLSRVERAFAPGPLRDDLARFGVRDRLEFAQMHALGPDVIHRAVARAAAVTDDHPSLEFHTWLSPFQAWRNSSLFNVPISVEFARGLEMIHRLRLGGEAPLLEAAPDVVAEVSRRRRQESHLTLGHLYALWGHDGPAIAEFEAAAQASSHPGVRARLLADAAAAARRAGSEGEASRLADESRTLLEELARGR